MKTYSIKDFRKEFSTERACLDYIFAKKYPNLKGYYFVEGRKCYANSKGKQIHPVKGTIFEKSSTPLTLWFFALYLFSVSKNGVSAKELQRQLGVTYKTAWRIGKQIRSLMTQGDDKLFGTVEVDETYIGGTRRLKVKMENKKPIIGLVERKGRLKANIIPNRETHTILNQVRDNVKRGSYLMTDDFRVYHKTPKMGYQRSGIKHSRKQYVRGNVHTNTIEGFWSQLKRSIDGTYHSVSKKHLQSYVDQFVFSRNFSCRAFEELVARI